MQTSVCTWILSFDINLNYSNKNHIERERNVQACISRKWSTINLFYATATNWWYTIHPFNMFFARVLPCFIMSVDYKIVTNFPKNNYIFGMLLALRNIGMVKTLNRTRFDLSLRLLVLNEIFLYMLNKGTNSCISQWFITVSETLPNYIVIPIF